MRPEPFDLTTFPNDEGYRQLVIQRGVPSPPFLHPRQHHRMTAAGVTVASLTVITIGGSGKFAFSAAHTGLHRGEFEPGDNADPAGFRPRIPPVHPRRRGVRQPDGRRHRGHARPDRDRGPRRRGRLPLGSGRQARPGHRRVLTYWNWLDLACNSAIVVTDVRNASVLLLYVAVAGLGALGIDYRPGCLGTRRCASSRGWGCRTSKGSSRRRPDLVRTGTKRGSRGTACPPSSRRRPGPARPG